MHGRYLMQLASHRNFHMRPNLWAAEGSHMLYAKYHAMQAIYAAQQMGPYMVSSVDLFKSQVKEMAGLADHYTEKIEV